MPKDSKFAFDNAQNFCKMFLGVVRMDGKTYKIGGIGVNFTKAPEENGQHAVVAEFEINNQTVRKVFQTKNVDNPMLKSDTILYKLEGFIIGKEARRRKVEAKIGNGEKLSKAEMRVAIKTAIAEAKSTTRTNKNVEPYGADMLSQDNPMFEESGNDPLSEYKSDSESDSVQDRLVNLDGTNSTRTGTCPSSQTMIR
jgi:hypothetical protein